jgi:heme oxygenase
VASASAGRASDSARFRLRSATQASHERVDLLFSRADLGDRESYGRFLTAQAAAHVPIERALTLADAATLLADWPQRRRASLLIADLTALDLPVPPGAAVPEFNHPAAVLGAMYVLEGSRLGGSILSRRVPAHLPTRFLRGDEPSLWREFIHVLDARLRDEEDLAIAATAATDVFAAFEDSARNAFAAVVLEANGTIRTRSSRAD